MWGRLAALLFLHVGSLVSASCPPLRPDNATDLSDTGTAKLLQSHQRCLNFSGRAVGALGNASVGDRVKELDLSDTGLGSLPQGFLGDATGLESLSLQGNNLKELPERLFNKTSKLKFLKLEKNLLRSVPVGDLVCLEKLTVDCSCDVVRSIDRYCKNCPSPIECQCHSRTGLFNATDFHAESCHGPSTGIYALAVIPVVALLAVIGLVYFLFQKKNSGTLAQNKRGSNSSDVARGQPRYISHAGPQGDAGRAGEGHADYANVFMEQPWDARAGQRGKSGPPSGPQGDQPIYANTQELYYNYGGAATAGPQGQDEEDLYIIPDK
ncbi:uncharacterized protein LOC134413144 [Elgaria multicarinata webbii]|uniref:uncharacterized protein LOC134413144 n=1 Tax=Elgaria multicarinata webbii TaxID=159646 RepID=UPI002FCCF23C